jgi:hypothetical protein
LSKDPILEDGGMNLYAYVGGNPVSRVDPLGLSLLDVVRIKNRYYDAMFDMAVNKQRVPGTGFGVAMLNNIHSYYEEKFSDKGYSTYERCYGQAEIVLQNLINLQRFGGLDDKWDFRMAHRPGHYWAEAVSSNKNDPVIKLDPWIGSFDLISTPTADMSKFCGVGCMD